MPPRCVSGCRVTGGEHAGAGSDSRSERGGGQARHVSRQREQLVQHRQKLEAQGRSLLINHGLPAPAHWWKNQTWSRLSKLLPAWICLRLEVHRPALLTLEQQISALMRSWKRPLQPMFPQAWAN